MPSSYLSIPPLGCLFSFFLSFCYTVYTVRTSPVPSVVRESFVVKFCIRNSITESSAYSTPIVGLYLTRSGLSPTTCAFAARIEARAARRSGVMSHDGVMSNGGQLSDGTTSGASTTTAGAEVGASGTVTIGAMTGPSPTTARAAVLTVEVTLNRESCPH